MGDTEINIQQQTQQSFSALQAGNGSKAKSGFEQIIALGRADTTHWLGLAYACSQLGDGTAMLTAVDKSLELDPQNLRAVILKADYLQQQNKSREALPCYKYALKLAQNVKNPPIDIQQGLERAQKHCLSQEKKYQAHLIEKLNADGFTPGSANSRIQLTLDLMFGEKEIFYQQPRRFYYPELPQIQFYERDQFEWVAGIEEKTDLIRAELTSVMNDSSRFAPYVKADDQHLGRSNEGLEGNDNWSALYLWEYGRLVSENAAMFPGTIKALEAAPMPDIARQAPIALFSKLSAEMKIPPHNGLNNSRLICHLPLIVPENCGSLRVGNEERSWVEGEMLVFDDTIEHEAWNSSAHERVILLFEVWRPEIAEEERRLITTMLKAVKEYSEE